MRIAVNTRFLLKNKMEGFGWFTHEVFQRIVNQHPEHEFIFIFDRAYDPSFVYGKNVIPVKTGPQARHPWLFYWFFEYSVTRVLKKYKADIFVSPDGYLSLRSQTPSIAVVHDLNFEHFPADLRARDARYYKKYFPQFVKKADHVLTVSGYSKQDIVKTYQTHPGKITVSYNGADEVFVKCSDEDIKAFKQKTGVQQPFFLAVGSIHPRKNIARLLQAFDVFKKNTGSAFQLVIVGDRYHWTSEMEHTYQALTHKNDIVFTGHLSRQELVQAYSAAYCLVFPSYFEGFGIPLVEAMRCDCAVICANATSFPEVAADAALYFDPFDINDMASKMQAISVDEMLRKKLVEKGKERANLFTWDHTAKVVWDTIEKTARAKGILK